MVSFTVDSSVTAKRLYLWLGSRIPSLVLVCMGLEGCRSARGCVITSMEMIYGEEVVVMGNVCGDGA